MPIYAANNSINTSLRSLLRATVRLELVYERVILVCTANKFYKYSATSLEGDSVF